LHFLIKKCNKKYKHLYKIMWLICLFIIICISIFLLNLSPKH
jgi:hypothetical protein